MKIQLKSDLHLESIIHKTRILVTAEVDPLYVSPEAEVLILAGDIINAVDYQLDYLIYKLKDVKIPILYVPGNHEYWGGDYFESRSLLKEKLKGTNITLFDKEWMIIKDSKGEDFLFIGATMWTGLLNPVKANIARGTHDFYFIKNLTTEAWTQRHLEEFHYVGLVLQRPEFRDMKKIVVTHYLPSYQSVPERFKEDGGNCIFVAESCEDYLRDEDLHFDLWLHGHTHDSNDYLVGKKRVISNPKGRGGKDANGKYNNQLIIEI
jgi:predicted phosphodiesterase